MSYFQKTTDGKVHERPVREGFLLQHYVCGLELTGQDEEHGGPATCGKCKAGPVYHAQVQMQQPDPRPGAWDAKTAELFDYEIRHGGGGYFWLRAPDDTLIEGPSNRKWQGRDGAALGAWNHHEANT